MFCFPRIKAAFTAFCLLLLLGCSKQSNGPIFVGEYRLTDRSVTLSESVAYENLKEDPKIVAYLEAIRPKLKQLVTDPPQFKITVFPVFPTKWPVELSLYYYRGNLYSIYNLIDAPVEWYIANRALEFTPDGQIKIIDTGAQGPRK